MVYGPYPGIVREWHDGDTCRVDLDLGFGFVMLAHSLWGKAITSCRIYGINAPELNTDAGKVALQYALQLCPEGTNVTVTSHGWDKYGGRFDGSILLPTGADFGTAMLAAGHAVKFMV